MDFKKSFYKPVKPFYPFTYWEKNNTGVRDISKRYQNRLNYDPSCKLYLPFYKHGRNETVIYDQSGHGNNATITGAVYSSPSMKSGGELVNNGACTTDVDWTYGADWAWNAGGWYTKAGAGATVLEQDIGSVGNKMFTLTYTMTRTAGTLTPSIGGVNGTARVLSGTYTENIYATGTANLKFTPDAAFAGTVDVVSVRNTGGLGGYCDRVDDRFTITDFLDTGNSGQEITVLCWIYPHAFVNLDNIFAHLDYGNNQRAWVIRYSLTAGKFEILISNDGTAVAGHLKDYISSVTLTAYKFNLVGFVFNAGTLSLYLNGLVDSNPTKTTDDAITTIWNSTAALTVACRLNNGVAESFAEATYGEVFVFNRVLNGSEIRNIYEITRRKYGI